MVLMFLIASIYLWLKPERKSLVVKFGIAGVFILVFMMAYVNKFTVVPMGNF